MDFYEVLTGMDGLGMGRGQHGVNDAHDVIHQQSNGAEGACTAVLAHGEGYEFLTGD